MYGFIGYPIQGGTGAERELRVDLSKSGITVDKREPAILREIFSLESYLEAGDYSWKTEYGASVGIERKSLPDLISSIRRSTLWSELRRLVEHYDLSILLIEWTMKLTETGGVKSYSTPEEIASISWDEIFNTLLSVQGIGIFVTYSRSEFHTPERLLALQAYFNKEEHKAWLSIPKPAIPAGYLDHDLQQALGMLMLLPGIEQELATRLLKHFSSLRNILLSEPSQLKEVRGIGKIKAESIVNFLSRDFDSDIY